MFIPSSISPQNSILPQMEQSRLSELNDLANPARGKSNKELITVAKQFESVFIHQLLKSMRSSVQKSSLFDSHASKMFESLHDEEMSKLMSEQKGIGLADIIYRDLARLESKINKQQENKESAQKLNQSINLQG
jgi:flagellar protein FlgJ